MQKWFCLFVVYLLCLKYWNNKHSITNVFDGGSYLESMLSEAVKGEFSSSVQR